ncbi:MAG: LysR family transcriptional regulator [Boseongicola sp.]|nr:LysR family transcriptional regulator [Boseongicola sp.]
MSQLQAFAAIYDENSVVRAAQTLGVSQSGVSKQLARLRDHFDDDLFVKTADGMLPTPRAISIEARIRHILEEIDALDGHSRLQPDAFSGTFRIMATDEILKRLMPALDQRLSADAPDLRLTTVPLSNDYGARDLETGQINMVIAVNWHAREHFRQRLLFRDQFKCVMHREHPQADGPLTAESYCETDHVLVAPLGHDSSMIDRMLGERGLNRRITRSVGSFSLLTSELLRSDRMVTVPSAVAQGLLDDGNLRVLDPPFMLPSIDYFALWHPRFQRDERVTWMLDAVLECLRTQSLSR